MMVTEHSWVINRSTRIEAVAGQVLIKQGTYPNSVEVVALNSREDIDAAIRALRLAKENLR
ncbi:hypothetical protein [Leptolyngbya sp. FACHB-16]|uniref:hypothetical protein n=1 Tax=unclassified Leptolyngbya TaxID=2650499 RepID=UPI0016845A62|nr:hypothetical protein [Leptolyngbya sp. FACHB-16]MBD2156278.1 hypothetical protein [Leptolyngbya sp. FACHB-16]